MAEIIHETPTGIKIVEQGEPNEFIILKGRNWVAGIKFNGEKRVWEQREAAIRIGYTLEQKQIFNIDEKDLRLLYSAYNATCVGDEHGYIEDYIPWLERQLLARMKNELKTVKG